MDDRMKILQMLQDGSITADEAAKLLAHTDAPKPTSPPPTPSSTSAGRSNNGDERPRETSSSGIDFEALGRKFGKFARDMEPKVRKGAEILADQTVKLANKVSGAIESRRVPKAPVESHVMPSLPRAERPDERKHKTSSRDEEVKQVELRVDSSFNELKLSAQNAELHVRGLNGDKISAKITYVPKTRDAKIELKRLGSKYYLDYDEDDFNYVAIDAYVPSALFNVINLSVINGSLDFTGVSCDELFIEAQNSSAKISEIEARRIKSETGNSVLIVSDIACDEAVFEHHNGNVEFSGIDAAKLLIENFNSPVSLSSGVFAKYDDYLWKIETSNARLMITLPPLPNVGYHIIAASALGETRLRLSGLEFLIHETDRAEARTTGFDLRQKRVRMDLSTSGAPLTVT